jgi:hypothetical protein
MLTCTWASAALHFSLSLLPACRYDKYCPFYKSVDMLRNMIAFYTAANEAVERTAAGGGAGAEAGVGKITFNVIKARLGDLLYKLRWVGRRVGVALAGWRSSVGKGEWGGRQGGISQGRGVSHCAAGAKLHAALRLLGAALGHPPKPPPCTR